MRHIFSFLLIGTLFMVSFVSMNTTEAIPVFARKYETSCVTCHIGFPKLNSFGEAFRLNGFQYPKHDFDHVDDEPVSLGSEAYKRVFPNSVWPNDIPGTPPISFRVRSEFSYVDQAAVKTKFGQPSLILMTAGTLGENVGFYAGAHLFENGEVGSIDRAYLQLSNLFGSTLYHALSLRIGQFIPNIVPFANHRGLALTPYAFNTYSATSEGFEVGHAHGGESFGLETFQLGVEASGIINKRIKWGAGFVNGSGVTQESNTAKDGYLSASYKFGGMAYDGTVGAQDSKGRNWIDNSIALGSFAYFGSHENGGVTGPTDLRRERYGADFNILLNNSNLFGGWIRGRDEAIEGGLLVDKKYDLAFAELNQVFYPWLIGLARYERAKPVSTAAINRTVLGFTALYRANIKFVVETAFDPDDIEFSNLNISLDFAM